MTEPQNTARIMSENERNLRLALHNRRQFYMAQLGDIAQALDGLEDPNVQKTLFVLSVANRPCGIPGGVPPETAPDGPKEDDGKIKQQVH